MKKYFTGIFIFALFCSNNSDIHNDEVIAVQSLHYLNKQFYLHLKKMNEPVLISINNYYYVCNDFIDKDTLPPIARLRFQYELKKIGDSKYEFVLKVVSEIKGSFEVSEKNGQYNFSKLRYVKISP